MAAPTSAGVLLYRHSARGLEVLLIHPGGPFWRRRRPGSWMIPKGEIEPGEAPAEAALREFEEETGARLDSVPLRLCEVRQSGGKRVAAFAVEGDFDTAALDSNLFTLEWPPKSGQMKQFPEAEEARWFTLPEARVEMLASQRPMLDALETQLKD
ncbi:NUDIX domain-containing protein [Sphingomonas ginkgonis]|uniref:NUDIX domain-containing protein n=1 Tax=Sphingomonas ginkgonis TaxID=2315330 RepID=A0A429VD78_9SPHN|nr:NUDIX domain-containing protein [Sphingomonas ginkgonis]RST31960.1 NUDIX domain-containing protein [Sphingomonas ginkgonis]